MKPRCQPLWLSVLALWLCGWMWAAQAGTSAAPPGAPVQATTGRASLPLDIAATRQGPVSLTPWFAVLEDPGRKLSLQEVQQPELASRFMSGMPAEEAFNFDYTKSAYWLRLNLRNDSDHAAKRMLEISYDLISQIDFYQPDAQGRYHTVHTGNAEAFASRPYPNAQFAFPLLLPAHGTQVIYLRLQSSNTLIVPGRLWDVPAWHAAERNNYLIQSAYYGMGIAIILFNLLLAILLRDMIYLRYILYMTSMMLALGAEKGLTAEFLWPQATAWQEMSADFLGTFSIGGILLFMREMLDTATTIPRADKLFKVMLVLYAMTLAGLIWDFPAFVELSTVLVTLTVLVILLTGIYCACKRQRSAFYFLLAFGQWSVGAFATPLRFLGYLPTNNITVNILQFCSALEMLLLAFALADRFNRIIKGREQAQKEALLAQQQLVESLQESERLLEQRVAERSSDLAQSNLELARANQALEEARTATESSRHMAEQARQQLDQTMQELHAAESRLVLSEKMAVLGQLVGGIANEINVPVKTVKISGKQIAGALQHLLTSLPRLLQNLNQQGMALFLRLIRPAAESLAIPAASQNRQLLQQLKQFGLANPRRDAKTLLELHAQTQLSLYAPLLEHADADMIMDSAAQVTHIIHGTEKINAAVDQVSKLVSALRSFSHFLPHASKIDASLQDGIEIILILHQNRFKHGVVLQRHYQPLPKIRCIPGELNQVWNNLIQNALEAMPGGGTLQIGIGQHGTEAVVSISDSGGGIDAAHLHKIFDPFFTTKCQGHGNGMGLSIAKKIIDKHQGRIVVSSPLRHGTTVQVYLPMT